MRSPPRRSGLVVETVRRNERWSRLYPRACRLHPVHLPQAGARLPVVRRARRRAAVSALPSSILAAFSRAISQAQVDGIHGCGGGSSSRLGGARQRAPLDCRPDGVRGRAAAAADADAAPGVADLGAGEPDHYRVPRPRGAALQRQVPLGAADGPLRAPGPRAPARLARDRATEPRRKHRRARSAGPRPATLGGRPCRTGGGVLLGHAGRRDRRVPPGEPGRRRAGPGRVDVHLRLPRGHAGRVGGRPGDG